MASLVRILEDQADHQPDKVGWIVEGQARAYGQLAEAAVRFASGLRELGLEPGDRISILLPNSQSYLTAYFGAMRAGLVVNLLNTAFTAPEVRYLMEDCGSSALVTNAELLPRVRDAVAELGVDRVVLDGRAEAAADGETGGTGGAGVVAFDQVAAAEPRPLEMPDEDAPCCLPYSSGTTGHPKGIVHTHRTLAAQAVLSANHLLMSPDDVIVQALPLFHLFGGNIILGGILVAGGALAVQARFEAPGMIDLLERTRATLCAGVPTTFALLTQQPETVYEGRDLRALKAAYCAGAPLPARVQADFLVRFGVRILNCYGITEAGGNLTGTPRYGEAPELTCGIAYPLTRVRIVDDADREVPVGEVGELVASGPQIMTGYWNRPEDTAATLRNGCLHTGDLARQDEHGFYFIVDRKKDMIITGGFNVYPAEVENALSSHPQVSMCAVFGVPEAVKGEQPWAAVVLRPGATAGPADLDGYCRQRLAAYKVPRRFLLVEDLPRSSLGKLLRRELRQRYAPAASADLDNEQEVQHVRHEIG